MSAQRDIVCESSVLLSTLGNSDSQPPTPKINHLRLCEPLPALELSELDDFAPASDFELEWHSCHKPEYTVASEETQDPDEMSSVPMRNSFSDSALHNKPFAAKASRFRVMSETCARNVPSNLVFSFLSKRKKSAQILEIHL